MGGKNNLAIPMNKGTIFSSILSTIFEFISTRKYNG